MWLSILVADSENKATPPRERRDRLVDASPHPPEAGPVSRCEEVEEKLRNSIVKSRGS